MEHDGAAPTTVTVAVQVDVLPQPSLTVSVTVLFPILVQLKLVLDSVSEAIPLQLSDEPLFTWAAVTVAAPLTRVTVTFLQFALGAVRSCTVMVWLQVPELPQPSVAFHVRVIT